MIYFTHFICKINTKMHQLIFSPIVSPSYLGSNVVDIDKENIEKLKWNNIFTYINVKYNIPYDRIKIKNYKGSFIGYNDVNPYGKFSYKKYCYYNSAGKSVNNYLVNFDIR